MYDVKTLYHNSPCHPIATLYPKIYIQVANLYYSVSVATLSGAFLVQRVSEAILGAEGKVETLYIYIYILTPIII